MKVEVSYLDMIESLRELSNHIQDRQMGQRHGYSALQDQMNQNQLSQLANAYGNLGGIGAGQLAGIAQLKLAENPAYIQEPIFPGKVMYPDSYYKYPNNFHKSLAVEKIAEEFGFEYDFNCDSYTHKSGGSVTKRMLEDSRYPLRELFNRAKTPNISWLDDRIEEIRVKLI